MIYSDIAKNKNFIEAIRKHHTLYRDYYFNTLDRNIRFCGNKLVYIILDKWVMEPDKIEIPKTPEFLNLCRKIWDDLSPVALQTNLGAISSSFEYYLEDKEYEEFLNKME